MAASKDSFGRLLAALLHEVERGAHEVPPAWRLGGIHTVDEMMEWVECGVCDAHRAGILRAAGIETAEIRSIVCENGIRLGRAFAVGTIGLSDVVDAVLNDRTKRTG